MIAMGNMLSKILGVSIEEAVEVIAIQLTNGFEVNLPSMSGRAIYPLISYFNHSCVPNATHSHKVMTSKKSASNNPGKKFFLELKVQRTVPAGTELTIRYNSVYEVTKVSAAAKVFNKVQALHFLSQGFVKRQQSFMQEWFFECCCPRCSDPTEFETFTSAVKCFQCRKGCVIPYPTLLNSSKLNGKETSCFKKVMIVFEKGLKSISE
jgi:hypothetical protein